MSQEIHVTSQGIGSLIKRLDTDLTPLFTGLRDGLSATDIPAPGFGQVGDLILGGEYHSMQVVARDILQGVVDVIDDWQATLGVAAKNWRTAEDANIVRYQ